MSLGRKIFKLFSCVFAYTFFMCAGIGTANAVDSTYTFSVTTVPLEDGSSFSFKLSAAGTFKVSCGGGTLSSSASPSDVTGSQFSGFIITRSNTNEETYTCNYQLHTVNGSATSRTIQFGMQQVTGYNSTLPAISFFTSAANAAKVQSMDLYQGTSLADVFPDNVSGSYPRFWQTFKNCSNLQSIPNGLFKGYTSSHPAMFVETFMGCESLTSIPNDLFEDFTSVDSGMFQLTFRECTGLLQLPTSLFANITTIQSYQTNIFMETFSLCTGLTGFIPPTLFAGLTPRQNSYPQALMDRTFLGSTLDTSCPAGFCEYDTGYKTQNVWYPYVSCKPCVTITYDCNDGVHNTSNDSYAQGTMINTNDSQNGAPSCTAPTGSEFVGWYCGYGDSSNNSLVSFDDIDTNHPVHVYDNFVCFDSECEFALDQNTFCTAVWRKTNPCENDGTPTTYILGSPASVFDPDWWDDGASSSGSTFTFSAYGTAVIETRCSVTPGVPGQPGNPVTTPGGYCWCRVASYTPNSSSAPAATQSGDLPWVLADGAQFDPNKCDWDDDSGCLKTCKAKFGEIDFRRSLYTTTPCGYTVTYDCGVGSSSTLSPTSVVVDQPYSISPSSYCTPNTGYVPNTTGGSPSGSGWVCEADNSNATLNAASGTWTAHDDYTCTAQWASHSLSYNCGITGSGVPAVGNGPASQSFAGVNSVTISNPGNTCTATGYSFDGWWCYDNNAGFYSGNIYTPNSSYAYGNGSATCVARWKANDPCAPGTLDTETKEVLGILMLTEEMNDPGTTWKDHFSLDSLWGPDAVAPVGVNGNEVTFPYATIVLEGLCSVTPGIPGQAGYPDTTNTDQHCWCRVAKFEGEELTDYPWVYYQDFTSSGTNCSAAKCSEVCANGVYNDWNDSHDFYLNFLHSLYVKNICLYTLRYKCDSSATATYGGSYADGVNVPLWNSATTAANCPSQAANGQELDVWTCDNNVTVNNNSQMA